MNSDSFGVISFAIIFFGIIIAILVLQDLKIRQKNAEIRGTIYSGNFIPYFQFEKNWIAVGGRPGRSGLAGYKYEDGPGCYVILIFDHPVTDGNWADYENIYIGQSVKVCQRVHNHFNGKGNGDVYADIRSGKFVYVQFEICEMEEMNDLEKELIEAFNATSSYNKTRGGGKRR